MLNKVKIVIHRERNKQVNIIKSQSIFACSLAYFAKSHNCYFTIEVSNWLAAKASVQRWV